jgi:hypothetical protein
VEDGRKDFCPKCRQLMLQLEDPLDFDEISARVEDIYRLKPKPGAGPFLRRLPEPWRTRLCVRLGRWRWQRQGCPGDSHQWVWSRDQPFDRATCRQLLDQHFLPAFTRIAQAAPQPCGIVESESYSPSLYCIPQGQPLRPGPRVTGFCRGQNR